MTTLFAQTNQHACPD